MNDIVFKILKIISCSGKQLRLGVKDGSHELLVLQKQNMGSTTDQRIQVALAYLEDNIHPSKNS
jgi:4-hydroxy-3-methylbut-2-en-1-yl diphosphate synthase IspG/GcpE